MMGVETEHQDGMIARYIISKGMPESIQITSKRLARFCATCLSKEVVSDLPSEDTKELNRKGFTPRLRLKARDDLRNAYKAQRVLVDGRSYRVMRVEDWPEYHIALELEGLDSNGNR